MHGPRTCEPNAKRPIIPYSSRCSLDIQLPRRMPSCPSVYVARIKCTCWIPISLLSVLLFSLATTVHRLCSCAWRWMRRGLPWTRFCDNSTRPMWIPRGSCTKCEMKLRSILSTGSSWTAWGPMKPLDNNNAMIPQDTSTYFGAWSAIYDMYCTFLSSLCSLLAASNCRTHVSLAYLRKRLTGIFFPWKSESSPRHDEKGSTYETPTVLSAASRMHIGKTLCEKNR